jgi:hypothetical protein
MMGDRLVMQESLFYQFRLDDHIPADHMLRAIDRFVDLEWEPVSFGHTPPSKVKTLAAPGFVILEITAKTIARASRWYSQGVQKAF